MAERGVLGSTPQAGRWYFAGQHLVTVTQAALTALVLTLYITSAWQLPGRRLPGRAGLVATLSTAAFSSCCCCSPAIFPLLARSYESFEGKFGM